MFAAASVVLICVTVPMSVTTAVPLPATAAPPAEATVSVPWATERIVVIALVPASASLTASPAIASIVLASSVWEPGTVLTGASLAPVGTILTV